MDAEGAGEFSIDIEARPGWRLTAAYALQHLLALTGIWIFPVLIGQALSLDTPQVGAIIQACFMTTGLVTLLQSSRMLRLPVVQGPTAVFFVALIAGARSHDLGTAFGSMATAGAIFALLSLPLRGLSLVPRVAPFIAAPVVYGTLMLIIGGQLAGYGLPNWFGQGGPGGIDFLSALATAITILACLLLGGTGMVRRAALLIGILVGSVLHIAVSGIDTSAISHAALFRLPTPAPFGLGISWPLVALMLLAYVQASAEAIGMYSLLAGWAGQQLTTARIARGLFGEFAGCAVGAVFGGLGTTSYAENVGIIRVSGIGSRTVTMMAGAFALLVGMLPVVGVAIASLPGTVLAAASTILFGIIALSGVQMMRKVVWDEFNLVVASVPFILSLGCGSLPPALFAGQAQIVRDLLTQPMLVGILLLVPLQIVVNVLIRPRVERARKASEPTPA